MHCARMRNTLRIEKWPKPAWIKALSPIGTFKLYMFIRNPPKRLSEARSAEGPRSRGGPARALTHDASFDGSMAAQGIDL